MLTSEQKGRREELNGEGHIFDMEGILNYLKRHIEGHLEHMRLPNFQNFRYKFNFCKTKVTLSICSSNANLNHSMGQLSVQISRALTGKCGPSGAAPCQIDLDSALYLCLTIVTALNN